MDRRIVRASKVARKMSLLCAVSPGVHELRYRPPHQRPPSRLRSTLEAYSSGAEVKHAGTMVASRAVRVKLSVATGVSPHNGAAAWTETRGMGKGRGSCDRQDRTVTMSPSSIGQQVQLLPAPLAESGLSIVYRSTLAVNHFVAKSAQLSHGSCHNSPWANITRGNQNRPARAQDSAF